MIARAKSNTKMPVRAKPTHGHALLSLHISETSCTKCGFGCGAFVILRGNAAAYVKRRHDSLELPVICMADTHACMCRHERTHACVDIKASACLTRTLRHTAVTVDTIRECNCLCRRLGGGARPLHSSEKRIITINDSKRSPGIRIDEVSRQAYIASQQTFEMASSRWSCS
jgi:hypothetical protein